MSFLATFLRSVPQMISISGATIATPADQTVTSVDVNASAVLFCGSVGAEGSGFLHGGNRVRLSLLNATHVRATVAVNAAGTVTVKGLLLEFRRLRQNVYYNTCSVATGATSATVNSGLTLGPHAFLIPAGFTSDYNTAASLNEGAHCVEWDLNIGTGVVTVTKGTTGANIVAGFFIVDPRV